MLGQARVHPDLERGSEATRFAARRGRPDRRARDRTYIACAVTYFHVLETGTGQTIGKRIFDLRVVSAADAGPASARAISIRSVLRVVDALPGVYLVGAIATGERRQRLGDLAAGTVVTRASTRPFTPARRSPLVTVYPALWIGAAIGLALLVQRNEEVFLARVDNLCRQADTAAHLLGPSPPLDKQLAIRVDLLRKIGSLPVPSDEVRQEQVRIFNILNQDAHLAAMALAHFRETGSQEQFRTEFQAVVVSSEDHSAQLLREFGLGNC